MLVYRLNRVLKDYFHDIADFASFKGEVKKMTKIDKNFDIGKAWEEFLTRQKSKQKRNASIS